MPELRDPHHPPLVRDDGRGEAEGDHVRQAVVLLAESALRVGQARDAPVQRIEDHGNEYRHARGREMLIDRGNDGVKPREEAAGGQQVRQEIDPLAPRLDLVVCIRLHAQGTLRDRAQGRHGGEF